MKNVIGKLNIVDLVSSVIGLCLYGTGFIALFKNYSHATSVADYIVIATFQVLFAVCFVVGLRAAIKLGSDNE